MKKNNPHTPIMLREARGTEPRVFARYGFGKEKQEALSGRFLSPLHACCSRDRSGDVYRVTGGIGLSDKEIEEKVTRLVKENV